ncbi:MAG: NUDIX domain-containing protein [Candidatus Nanopelagicales bacterium]
MSDVDALPVKPAATVVLLRDGSDGLEVWLQQRAATLAFAAGMYAFPGGAVDAEDHDVVLPDSLLVHHATVWSDVAATDAAAHLAAAVRETYEECGVALDPLGVVPWARWITPPGQSRRFDARFYIAGCPADQEPQALTGEVAHGKWFGLRRAVDTHAAGALPMWPPTISTLQDLLPFDDVAAAMAAAPSDVEAVRG